MVTFLKIVAQLTAAGAKVAWANKGKILDMIARGLGVQYIIDWISSKI